MTLRDPKVEIATGAAMEAFICLLNGVSPPGCFSSSPGFSRAIGSIIVFHR